MSFYSLLKTFCEDAYHELLAMKEIPQPPYDTPLLAGNPYLTNWGSALSKLSSHEKLLTYMETSGLEKKLGYMGYTWAWHEVVFEWLFLERVIVEGGGTTLDEKTFNKIFRRAQAEVNRPFIRIRQITTLVGVPDINRPIKISSGTFLSPINFSMHHYQLAGLLGWRYQDKHRAPAFWINPDSRLIVQTRLVKKDNDGNVLRDVREQMKYESNQIIKAIKVSLDAIVLEKHVFSSYLSSFPLLPVDHHEIEETKGSSVSVTSFMKNRELRDIRRCYDYIRLETKDKLKVPEYFISSLDRFASSFRTSQTKQSVVDLIVSLEALFPVGDELRYRLAICVASTLGTNDNERMNLYRRVSAGYKLRNSIVHGGGKNQTDKVVNALRDFFPELKGNP